MQTGTEELSNGNRRAERFSGGACGAGPGEMDRAPSQNRNCEVTHIRSSVLSLQLYNQTSAGHKHGAVNVAERLRVECGHVLVVVNSSASQNLLTRRY